MKKSLEDAITREELQGTAHSASSASPRNAFSALMNKRKASPPSPVNSKKPHNKNTLSTRDGLGAYIDNPDKYDASRIIYHDDNFVAINDLYPKSSVHALLLPRSQKYSLQHPFDAFEDAEFLASVQESANKLRDIIGKELQRQYGKYSKQDIPREKVLNGEVEIEKPEDMPVGRDWNKEVKVGIHAQPSMNHLHIHVLSVDHYSECVKHRKHYNSFATPFFVELEAFPLAKDDVRRHPGKEGYLSSDLLCWRCEKNFKNKFARLKEHLSEEFEEWKKE
ncbi:related to HNT3 Member of the third branch of the histidine triad (HIT) superfamily of nucleotide-binding proteins [Rhynchosporium agropyri]|uniref:Aprataxin-like protein n=1 Tax=Rhynchosporium agropyri TaxID=914238 RepID=A0A1E1LAA6_9HELO|nr:related to HNT3 Member of the third branch of the histidine triad (HIT) superfamily of nucleotide-binding proteins [Rhynchosporium agropyri]